MHAYEIRRGLAKSLAGDGLRRLVDEIFRSSSTEGDKVVTSFGAIRKLTTWTDGKSLFVDTQMDPGVESATAAETIRRYNAFLERGTGYAAKQRGKRERGRAKAAG